MEEYKQIINLSYVLMYEKMEINALKRELRESLGVSQWQLEQYLTNLFSNELITIDECTIEISEKGKKKLEEFGISKEQLENSIGLQEQKNFFCDRKLEEGEIYVPRKFTSKI